MAGYGIDPSFALNDFKTPLYYNESETVARNILFVLFGKPGFYPSMPTLGMNIQRLLYNFEDDINVSDIKVKLMSQCSAFYNEVADNSFDVYKKVKNGQMYLLIKIPTVVKEKKNVLVVGITTGGDKSTIYNYVYTQDAYY